ncbi:MAG: hypothetical protein P4L42_14405, partial [Desulfocapsaceae bacterium]|nr:hypothetical protein [Desulfocapsaceae bacterium]
MTRKFDFIFFLIILGASIILMLAGLTKGHDWGDDFSCYIMQAKSIVNFSCYKFLEVNQFTIEQSS